MRTFAAILTAGVVACGSVSALAQSSITVRPLPGDGLDGGSYVGPYGRELPGVYMFEGRAVPVTPRFADGGVPIPSLRKLPNEFIYSQSELPILDGWRGTLSDGIPF